MKPQISRCVLFCVLVLAIFGAMFTRLGSMQIQQQEDYVARAESRSTKTIIETGKRGTIYDANMIPLAYDRECFDVQFYRDPSRSSAADRAAYTQAIISAIELIEANGKTTITEFWLARDEEGNWQFDTGSSNPSVQETRIRQWRSNFMLNTEPVEELFDTLCENYAIPDDLDEEMKLKVLAIWQASRMTNFTSSPVTIAYDVDFQTVSEIEARADELIGFSILESSTRVYPQKSLAAHVVGYTSKINSESLEEYQAKGYPNDAIVGAAGIESSMEDQLSPYIEYRQGQKYVEIDTRGKAVRELSYTAPTDGNSIVLTIDSKLQEAAERYLERIIETVHAEQLEIIADPSWQATNRDTLNRYIANNIEIQLAQSGAIVCMDPYSGRILAMASYPDYDLSLFEGTIDMGSWTEIIYDDRNPMFNRAIGARDTPGSIYKMVTALGSLVEGNLTLDRRISDEGEYLGTDTVHHPRCWINPSRISQHANQTVVEGLSNSCNYFFYTIGEELGITNITKWAAALGLTSKTNVELPGESTSFVGNQQTLYDSSRTIAEQYTDKPRIAYERIYARLVEAGTARGVEYDEDQLDRVARMIMDVVNLEGTKDEVWPPAIREILLYEMGLPSEYISQNYMVNDFFNYINDLKWTPNETIMVAIGQSITQVTPIAVARYVSAIVNGGTVYDAQIIDQIIAADGTVVLDKQPVVANQINADPAYFAAIRQGMANVTSTENDGTAAAAYENAKYPTAAKTGTSQRTELDVENNGWHVAYAPVEDPKLVVVVYVQNGYSGAKVTNAAKYTLQYYLDHLQQEEGKAVQSEYSMAE